MRLICPNCDAQYEVPDDVIPEGGRDVQCSNCSTTWFFSHTDQEAGPPEEAGPTTKGDLSPEDELTAALEGILEDETPKASKPRLDPDVMNVLREEAEFEARARASEAATLESQPELGLDDMAPFDETAGPDVDAGSLGDQVADAPDTFDTSDPSETAVTTAIAAGTALESSRRGLLPDIEEINSTLRTDESAATEATSELKPQVTEAKQKGGFWFGALLAVILMAVALALYVFAPEIKAQVPQASAVLDTYVAKVDMLRDWLDAKTLQLLEWFDAISSQTSTRTQ